MNDSTCRIYKFHGWDDEGLKDVRPLGTEFAGINNPFELYDALSLLWCRPTCAPRLRKDWHDGNVTVGQCSITAFLVQDIFGGEVRGILRPGGNYHCFNVVDGHVFDLTSEQFGDEVLDYSNWAVQSRDVHFAKDEKHCRYIFLRELLDGWCRYGIRRLLRADWENAVIPFDYETDSYYDVEIEADNGSDYANVRFTKKSFVVAKVRSAADYNFGARLYQPQWPNSNAWGIVIDSDSPSRKLRACIETSVDEWGSRLLVTELWIYDKLRRQGIGRALMNIAKREAELEGRRAVIIETQTCNTRAIEFLRAQGFRLVGFDSCCYSNDDISHNEVRVELGWFPTTM